MYELVCTKCKARYKPKKNLYLCDCGYVFLVEWKKLVWKPEGKGVWRYKVLLPFEGKEVRLEEGGTSLVKSETIEKELGLKELYFKLEGENPTDSFKDRGSTLVISRARQEGFESVSVASTGNMGASVCAYAAHAGLRARVFIPSKTPEEKLKQIIAYGGKLEEVRGGFKECVDALWKTIDTSYLAMTGLNPYYIEGEKTLGFELYEDIGIPDKIIVPMGTGGLITAIWKAFKELHELGKIRRLPQMIGVQGEGCSPIVDAWKEGHEKPKHIRKAKSLASAILIKTPFNGHTAIRAINESGGFGVNVTDNQIIKAIKDLGMDGIFAEPAAASTLAALRKIDFKKDEKIILVITGHGLKQPISLK